jgi:hypothetical protein
MWAVMITRAASIDHYHALSRGTMSNSGILQWCILAEATKHKLFVG